MKMQWRLTLAFLFALVIAVFAVINVKSVPVSYLFGVTHVPLILLILGSALVGALSLLLFGIVFQFRVLREKKSLERQLASAEQQLELLHRNAPAGNTLTADGEPAAQHTQMDANGSTTLADEQ